MNVHGLVLAVCTALMPSHLRQVREEQWVADLRDGPELGISRSSLLYGAVCSSVSARVRDLESRCQALFSNQNKGEIMKLGIGLLGTAALIVGGLYAGVQAPVPQAAAPNASPVGGYEGWWNSTPVSGIVEGLPRETVSVNTRTGKVVDAFNRSMNEAGKVTNVSDVDFTVIPDPEWPANSVVIIDTASGDVIESFPVDDNGEPIMDASGNSLREKPNY